MPAVAKGQVQKTSQSRVFTIRNQAGPANAPVYQTLARALAAGWPQGDVTPIRIPNPDKYEDFIIVDQIKGLQGLPTVSLEFRLTRDLSEVLKLVRENCPFDVQLHIGACKTPSDFNGGWEKVLIWEGASITGYDTGELGALDGDQNAVVNETIPVTALDHYQVKPLVLSEVAASQIVQEVIDITICDSKTCGECGIASDGCQKVFAITMTAGGSPGLPAEVIFSEDGGLTFDDTNVTTLGASDDPSALACVGSNLVVISNASCSLHYAPIADILDGIETWTEVATGFVCPAGAPNDIFSLGRTFTWIVGDAGYIYFSDDIEAGVDVQSAGAVTVQNLNAIHGVDILNLVAVGANNAVVVTANGGATWASVTGPAVGVALNAIWMRSASEWFVGTAGGRLYYTRDSGASWTEKAFPGSGSGVIYDIAFSSPSVGYLAHATATPAGRILRTIDGGHSWYVLPEDTGSMPANDKVNALAVCSEDKNIVYGGGLGDNATDGFMVKGA